MLKYKIPQIVTLTRIALMVGKPEERRYKTKKDLTSKS